MDNDKKLEQLADLKKQKENHEEILESVKSIEKDFENGNPRVELAISTPYLSKIYIHTTKDIISHLISNETKTLDEINVKIDNLLNGEAIELRNKITAFGKSLKE